MPNADQKARTNCNACNEEVIIDHGNLPLVEQGVVIPICVPCVIQREGSIERLNPKNGGGVLIEGTHYTYHEAKEYLKNKQPKQEN